MAGRPRKPKLTLIDQRPSRMKARADELVLSSGPLGDAPAWFGPAALQEWNRLTQHPEYSRVLSPVHRSGLIALCALTQREMDDFTGAGKMSASDRQMLNSLRMQFAVTPASQAKVKIPAPRPAESKWAVTKPTGT